MLKLTEVLKGLSARIALASMFAIAVSTCAVASPVTVTMDITADDEFTLFAVDPNTNLLTLIGQGNTWQSLFTFNFVAQAGSYIYVVGSDNTERVAMFVSKTVFNASDTVLTGDPNSWEVNTRYRANDFTLTDPNEVLNWGGDWQAPAIGGEAGTFATAFPASFGHLAPLGSARCIWAQPGGGNSGLFGAWGFPNDTALGSALFRLEVVPEPASMLALGAGLAGLLGLRRRKG
jgi:hypothetical protein